MISNSSSEVLARAAREAFVKAQAEVAAARRRPPPPQIQELTLIGEEEEQHSVVMEVITGPPAPRECDDGFVPTGKLALFLDCEIMKVTYVCEDFPDRVMQRIEILLPYYTDMEDFINTSKGVNFKDTEDYFYTLAEAYSYDLFESLERWISRELSKQNGLFASAEYGSIASLCTTCLCALDLSCSLRSKGALWFANYIQHYEENIRMNVNSRPCECGINVAKYLFIAVAHIIHAVDMVTRPDLKVESTESIITPY